MRKQLETQGLKKGKSGNCVQDILAAGENFHRGDEEEEQESIFQGRIREDGCKLEVNYYMVIYLNHIIIDKSFTLPFNMIY